MNRNRRRAVANVKAALLGDKIISDNEMAAILSTIDAVQLAGTAPSQLTRRRS